MTPSDLGTTFPPAITRAHLLLVDDEAGTWLSLEGALERGRWEVVREYSLAAALGALEQFRPAAVVLRSVRDGLDLPRCVNSLLGAAGPEPPGIVVLLGASQAHLADSVLDAGACDLFSEPFDWRRLLRQIELLRALHDARVRSRELKRALHRLEAATGSGLWSLPVHGCDTLLSRGARRLLAGDEEAAVAGTALLERLAAEDRADLVANLRRARREQQAFSQRLRIGGREQRVVELRCEVERDKLELPRRLTGVVREVTDEAWLRDRMEWLRNHDPLTGLANRESFLCRAGELTCSGLAAIDLDLDGFTLLNERLGRGRCDDLLRQAGAGLGRLASAAGAHIARYGGDEFVALLPGADLSRAETLAQALLEAIRKLELPHEREGLRLTASVGLAAQPASGVETLLEQAHTAMVFARASGGDRLQHYDACMASTYRLSRLAGEAAGGMSEQELVLHYQPIHATEDHSLVGLEALLRWRHPRAGLIAPGLFLPSLRAPDAQRRLARWVVREACRQLSRWRGAGLRSVPVHLNLDDPQLGDDRLPGLIEDLLGKYQLPPGDLVIEVNSGVLLREPDRLFPQLLRLARLGLRLLLDRCHTPVAGVEEDLIAQLFDGIKLEQKLLAGRESTPPQWVEELEQAGMMLTAVGVESLSQLRRAARWHCTRFQGFLLGRPLSTGEVTRLLREE